jgi:hypothetical protein
LRQRFSQLPDTRQPGKVLHRLDEALLCAFCAILCDAESYSDMEDFAASQLSWLRGTTVAINAIGAHQAVAAVFGDTPAAAPSTPTSACKSLASFMRKPCVRGFCRAYYFAFDVIGHWVDPEFKSSGLGHFIVWCFRRRK